jgi:hypothetical protein
MSNRKQRPEILQNKRINQYYAKVRTYIKTIAAFELLTCVGAIYLAAKYIVSLHFIDALILLVILMYIVSAGAWLRLTLSRIDNIEQSREPPTMARRYAYASGNVPLQHVIFLHIAAFYASYVVIPIGIVVIQVFFFAIGTHEFQRELVFVSLLVARVLQSRIAYELLLRCAIKRIFDQTFKSKSRAETYAEYKSTQHHYTWLRNNV